MTNRQKCFETWLLYGSELRRPNNNERSEKKNFCKKCWSTFWTSSFVSAWLKSRKISYFRQTSDRQQVTIFQLACIQYYPVNGCHSNIWRKSFISDWCELGCVNNSYVYRDSDFKMILFEHVPTFSCFHLAACTVHKRNEWREMKTNSAQTQHRQV